MSDNKMIFAGVVWVVCLIAIIAAFHIFSGCASTQPPKSEDPPPMSEKAVSIRDSLVNNLANIPPNQWRSSFSSCYTYGSGGTRVCNDGIYFDSIGRPKVSLTRAQFSKVRDLFTKIAEYHSDVNRENRNIQKAIDDYNNFANTEGPNESSDNR